MYMCICVSVYIGTYTHVYMDGYLPQPFPAMLPRQLNNLQVPVTLAMLALPEGDLSVVYVPRALRHPDAQVPKPPQPPPEWQGP